MVNVQYRPTLTWKTLEQKFQKCLDREECIKLIFEPKISVYKLFLTL